MGKEQTYVSSTKPKERWVELKQPIAEDNRNGSVHAHRTDGAFSKARQARANLRFHKTCASLFLSTREGNVDTFVFRARARTSSGANVNLNCFLEMSGLSFFTKRCTAPRPQYISKEDEDEDEEERVCLQTFVGLELGRVLNDDGIVATVTGLAAVRPRAMGVLQQDRLAELPPTPPNTGESRAEQQSREKGAIGVGGGWWVGG